MGQKLTLEAIAAAMKDNPVWRYRPKTDDFLSQSGRIVRCSDAIGRYRITGQSWVSHGFPEGAHGGPVVTGIKSANVRGVLSWFWIEHADTKVFLGGAVSILEEVQ